MNQSWQDYIVAIYSINEVGEVATNKLISDRLLVSPPSVTDMVKKLKNEGLVHLEKGAVSLTDVGKERAKTILSKHRLWEYFLGEMLGYDWREVHEESKALQYVTSDKLMNGLNSLLNYPKRCPHGGVIYLNNIEEVPYLIDIYELNLGDKIRVERFSDEKFLLDYVDRKGIKLGDEFVLGYIDDFDGSVTLTASDGENIILSSKAIGSIFISKV